LASSNGSPAECPRDQQQAKAPDREQERKQTPERKSGDCHAESASAAPRAEQCSNSYYERPHGRQSGKREKEGAELAHRFQRKDINAREAHTAACHQHHGQRSQPVASRLRLQLCVPGAILYLMAAAFSDPWGNSNQDCSYRQQDQRTRQYQDTERHNVPIQATAAGF